MRWRFWQYLGVRSAALPITVAYALLGGGWIQASDWLVARYAYDLPGLARLQTAKGWLYVLVTALLLYPLIRGWERHQQQSEERYHALFDSLSDAVFVYRAAKDGHGFVDLVEVNHAACEWLGYSRSELLALSPDQLAGMGLALGRGDVAGVDIGDAPNLEEGELLTRDGRRITVEVSAHRLVYDDRQMVLAVARDIGERRAAQGELARERDLLHALMDNIPDHIYFKDLESRFTRINRAQSAVLGLADPSEATGRSDADYFVPDHVRDAAEDERRILSTGQPMIDKIERIRRADGEFRWVTATKAPIKDEGGRITGIVGISRDITERLSAERALRASEENYRLLVENANEVIVVAQDGWLRYVNRRAEELFGVTRQELLGNPLIHRIHPDDRALVMERHRARLRGEGYPRPYAFRVIGGRNEVRWVEASGVTMEWEGKPAALNFLSDITERKQAEDALRDSEERYRTLVENQGEGIAMADAEDGFTFANPAAEEIFGVEPGALVGRHVREFVTPEQLAVIEGQTALRRQGHKSTYEIEIERPDGEKRTILLTAAPRVDRAGRFAGTFGIFRDVTEHKRVEMERERLIAELQEALAQVKTLHGLLPICANCKRVRDDDGYWHMVEAYVRDHSQAEFTHTLCPECMAKLYPEYVDSEDSESSR